MKVETIGFTDGLDVGEEGKGKIPGLCNCMKCDAVY